LRSWDFFFQTILTQFFLEQSGPQHQETIRLGPESEIDDALGDQAVDDLVEETVHQLRAVGGISLSHRREMRSRASTHIPSSTASSSVSVVRACQWVISRSLASTSARISCAILLGKE
jgi:hypothetical protein